MTVGYVVARSSCTWRMQSTMKMRVITLLMMKRGSDQVVGGGRNPTSATGNTTQGSTGSEKTRRDPPYINEFRGFEYGTRS